MKPLISSIEVAQNTTKYDFNKMVENFEIERRTGERNKKIHNFWKNESKEYYKRIELMKQRREGVYYEKMNKLVNQLRIKEKTIKNQIEKNRKIKELKRIRSFDSIVPNRTKSQLAKDKYERKIKQDENIRRLNAKRVFDHCK